MRLIPYLIHMFVYSYCIHIYYNYMASLALKGYILNYYDDIWLGDFFTVVEECAAILENVINKFKGLFG